MQPTRIASFFAKKAGPNLHDDIMKPTVFKKVAQAVAEEYDLARQQLNPGSAAEGVSGRGIHSVAESIAENKKESRAKRVSDLRDKAVGQMALKKAKSTFEL